jgi:hypothetical protein
MAIVFDSDAGTITGLSVGGLPDGIVDAGTLATNSVDSAELIAGAVDDAHMTTLAASKLTGALPAISGASLTGLTSSQMPAGSILEVKTESIVSGYDMSTAANIALGSGVTFSSVGAGESILAVVLGGGLTLHRGNNNTDGIATLEIGGTKTYGGKNYAGMSGDYDWYAGGVCQARKYYSSSGSNILVRAYGHKNAGTYTSWNAAAGFSIQLVAYRIKGDIT